VKSSTPLGPHHVNVIIVIIEVYRHPATKEWYRRALTENLSLFCGWREQGQDVSPLVRARFNFMLLEEWAQSRPLVAVASSFGRGWRYEVVDTQPGIKVRRVHKDWRGESTQIAHE
jgi:hypothetical protein